MSAIPDGVGSDAGPGGESRSSGVSTPAPPSVKPNGLARVGQDDGALARGELEPLVRVRGLTKAFIHGGRQLDVLRGIDVDIARGEMLSVVGMSGAGKSTFLHILGALDRPTAGEIVFDGCCLADMSASQLATFRNRSIGFVFQFHHLLPEFTALENVMMPRLILREARAKAQGRAAELLDAVGLSQRMTHRPGELSGGEQQRVALARALVMQPKLLLADEPTGNLDRETSASIHDLFLRLNEGSGTTMLIVTHNPALARRMPRCLVMADGQVQDAQMVPAAPDRVGPA